MYRNIFASAAILACLAANAFSLKITNDVTLVSNEWA